MSKRKPPPVPSIPGATRRLSSAEKTGRVARSDAAWIYGHHAVLAAALNPRRHGLRLVGTPATAAALAAAAERGAAGRAAGPAAGPAIEVLDRRDIEKLLPPGAVHQGMAMLAEPLEEIDLGEFLTHLGEEAAARLVVLDQASDPRNVGAVLRSAAAFGARAVIVQERHSPEATGALAKAASGALEVLPMIRVTNIAQSLGILKHAGFWCLALSAGAPRTLAEFHPSRRLALVIGAEGKGLRRLVETSCDESVRIPISATIESLNVSVAAAVVLYEFSRQR